ncbi:hypothetical protein [Shouchella clausii]|uniref:hypothetical protein n=1 Tax=Shouchella clausii TaxID=79880 RepID=UPI001C737C73|nr:hypothetical protein [Shouchella clausii]MBX0320204.1 hypothetical protein [Shouchella clausii]MEB5480781.1 hypothetical protein [Shouchella clausii]
MAKKLTSEQKIELKKKFTRVMSSKHDVRFTPRKVDKNDPLLQEMLGKETRKTFLGTPVS